jgi:hypothetical protein
MYEKFVDCYLRGVKEYVENPWSVCFRGFFILLSGKIHYGNFRYL